VKFPVTFLIFLSTSWNNTYFRILQTSPK